MLMQSQASGAQLAVNAVDILNVSKTYPMSAGDIQVLHNVSFQVKPGEVVGIVGESGSGKSTLLHLLGTLDTPTLGEIQIAGVNPFKGSDGAKSLFRNRHIGFVFQHNNLLPEFTALENVMMPGLISGDPEKNVRQFALELLQRVGLSARMTHYPGQLSGGEQQRVAIARALINRPVLLLADEPSGNLDTANASNIHNLFFEVNKTLGTTVIVVTHNLEFAHTLPRRIELRDGRLISDQSLLNLT